ncbi:MAG: ABC transporter permease [Acidobacteria bacterium]|nr:ABC transporter permease [Acidobacteriota bacterium]
MIGTVVKVGWLGLRRDRVALALTFVLPIVFFSIFALVFGQQGRDVMRRVAVAVVDEAGSPLSARLVRGLETEGSLRVVRGKGQDGGGAPLDRAGALAMVREGDVPVAIVLPPGLSVSLGPAAADRPSIELLYDASDPIAPQLVSGILQKVAMTAAPDFMVEDGIGQFERYAGALTPEQRQAVDDWLPRLRAESQGDATAAGDSGFGGLVPVKMSDVLGEDRGKPLVAFYAAGIGVMFLLFSCAGAGGSLLEEKESGTLERLLSSKLGVGRLLLGKWLFVTLMGIAQLAVMFAWGMLVFGVPLLDHLAGWSAMTVVTAAAGAGFGILLATLARSRAQLSGLSTILILVMSALGGSMFPRFLMSEGMQKLGLLTFNGWALDGFIKVFWRDAPVRDLWPQLLVLCALAAVFLALSRLLARRWERA